MLSSVFQNVYENTYIKNKQQYFSCKMWHCVMNNNRYKNSITPQILMWIHLQITIQSLIDL